MLPKFSLMLKLLDLSNNQKVDDDLLSELGQHCDALEYKNIADYFFKIVLH